MCDAGMDGDMYDHSTDSGCWVVPGVGTIDPVRSDPRYPATLQKHGGNQKAAFEELTADDTPKTKLSALRKFLRWG